MNRLLDIFSSVKLTLALLLGLSLVAIGGTIWPVEQGEIQRYELYYQALWFRLLLGLLALNLAACSWRTLQRVLTEKNRLSDQLSTIEATDANSYALASRDADTLTGRLGSLGFRVSCHNDRLLARRGLSGRWALPVLHLSILAVMLGAWAAQLGIVGTMNIYVTHQSDRYFDWDVQGERPLGFTFQLDRFEPQYYPIDLRFAIYDPQSRKELQEFTTREGEIVAITPELSAVVRRFFPEEQHLVLDLLRNGVPFGEYHALSGSRSYPNSVDPGVVIKPTAFRDPIVKQLRSEVSIIENGKVVRQGVIEVNHPLVHRGVAIYQTAYNRDPSGFWFCGFQVSRDPGEPLVWVGSVIMCLALLLVFSVRYRVLGVIPVAGGCRLVPLAGYRGEVGRELLTGLATALGRGSQPSGER